MDKNTGPLPYTGELSADLLRGADEIARFLFGDTSHRRRVYHLAETSRVPIFRLGSILCARPSTLMAWITEQEKRGWNVPNPVSAHVGPSLVRDAARQSSGAGPELTTRSRLGKT